MADPTKLDLSDWISVIGAAIIAGIGSAMAWFNGAKTNLVARIDAMEADMRKWEELHAEHNTQLAVIKSCQVHTAERLEAINDTTHSTNQELKQLSNHVMEVLLDLKSRAKH